MTSDLRIESFKFVVIVIAKLIPASQGKAVVHIHYHCVPHCYSNNWP